MAIAALRHAGIGGRVPRAVRSPALGQVHPRVGRALTLWTLTTWGRSSSPEVRGSSAARCSPSSCASDRRVRALARSDAAATPFCPWVRSPSVATSTIMPRSSRGMRGCTTVFHVAGVNAMCLRDPSPMLHANVAGSDGGRSCRGRGGRARASSTHRRPRRSVRLRASWGPSERPTAAPSSRPTNGRSSSPNTRCSNTLTNSASRW